MTQPPVWDVAVIGGGIVGLATARALGASGRRTVVLEAEPEIAAHQTGHNSGVIHAGLYYRPGSEKARLCRAGRDALYRYCAERGIPHERCGKLIVATGDDEVPRLAELQARATANGLTQVRRVDPAQMREREPHVAGVAGLMVPDTGIVDYVAVARAYAHDLTAAGGEVWTAAAVTAVRPDGADLVLETRRGVVHARRLVNCAGLQSDRVARLCGVDVDTRIVPFRGDYCEIVPARRHLVRHLIYPVPDPAFPFLGVHLTRMIGGAVEAGPNAVLALHRGRYARTALSPRDAWDALSFRGLWKLMARHGRTGLAEVVRGFSLPLFVRALQRLVPEIGVADVRRAGCGIRAQALDRNGRLVDDFAIVERRGMVHVLNAPSPAATASLAIGAAIAERVVAQN